MLSETDDTAAKVQRKSYQFFGRDYQAGVPTTPHLTGHETEDRKNLHSG
jgi:hypothetical protein